jgi:hypothetical protein
VKGLPATFIAASISTLACAAAPSLLRANGADQVAPQNHWAFVAPVRPHIPSVRDIDWPLNAIDHFVLARLQREGMAPAQPADRTTLIRRVTLDLTGLPPTPEEVDAFVRESAPGAYERLVDRLLASPRYGERMTAPWLNAARYADTSGYQNDGPRHMWRWRDWVIDAFNRNLPFDEFTIDQVAGDMRPGATLDQRIATGFNRNHRGNAEGGIIPEEYAVEYVVDRVDTTSTVWLGLTMGCARCHDHKYDPFTQRDFYRTFAYFNNVPEHGRAIKEGNSPPFIQAPTDHDLTHLAALERRAVATRRNFQSREREIAAVQSQWEQRAAGDQQPQWFPTDGLVAHFELNDRGDESGAAPSAKFVDGQPAFDAGILAGAAKFDGRSSIDAGDVAKFGYFDRFSLAAWIRPETAGDHGCDGTIVSRMDDEDQAEGYQVRLHRGKLQVNLVKRWLDDAIRVETERTLEPDRWHHVAVTYDGSRLAKGILVYVDGRQEKLNVQLDFINQTFANKSPLRIGAGGGPASRFRGLIDDVRIYNDNLDAADVELLATPDSISELLSLAELARTERQRRKLRAYYVQHHAPDDIRREAAALRESQRAAVRFREALPTVMVMQELAAPRDTFLLVRGEYDKHGEKLPPGVPVSLHALAPDAPNNRLGFARWLVDPANPLTARVAVNRLWQTCFGAGLVRTVEDFGTQGDAPSHPELLDWLATEFVRSGWDMKALTRLIVTSATYRQTSKVGGAIQSRDPDNRLLARGPRFRLPAEMIRDQVLAASGLAVERIGGPSVKPYQPDGLWKDIATDTEYVQDHGENLYRRSLYTYWKRTVAPPSMMTFDASARETCTVRQTRTNTPLQALNLLNDVTYVESARVLAQRVIHEAGDAPESRLTLAFRLLTGRTPQTLELAVLRAGLDEHVSRFRRDPKAAQDLTAVGEYPRDEQIDASELAAYTAVASMIMNLDETLTRE